jgi:LmbE family N-acetylglucosaminyl deacetylase/SAM-dependent methyltransferase
MTETQSGPARPGVAAPDAGSSAVNSLAHLVDAGLGSGPSRILALGAAAAAPALALRQRGREVIEPLPGGEEEFLAGIARSSPGTFDAVLALGFIEHLRWDRWALQQIHRVLREGGVLFLAAPDLYSLRSLADPRYVAAKLAKVLPRLAPAGAAREQTRSYDARRLRETLARLGYEPLRWMGLARAGGRDRLGAQAWPPTHHLVLARRCPAAPGSRAALAEPAAEARRFAAENRDFLSLRDRWRKQLAIPPGPPRPLEPERYSGRHVLVLAPHPDDEIIGCGGTLLRLVRAGARVTVLQATDGSASAALEQALPAIQRTIRLEEARAVAESAGFEPTIFWREDNRAFQARADLVERLRVTLRELQPALVFTPFLADIHPDHFTLNRILAGALDGQSGEGMSVVGYEVWSLVPANLWCDVSSSMPDLERLLLRYETAMKVDDFIHMCRTRNRYHARALGSGASYAEAFFATDAPHFRDLLERR